MIEIEIPSKMAAKLANKSMDERLLLKYPADKNKPMLETIPKIISGIGTFLPWTLICAKLKPAPSSNPAATMKVGATANRMVTILISLPFFSSVKDSTRY